MIALNEIAESAWCSFEWKRLVFSTLLDVNSSFKHVAVVDRSVINCISVDATSCFVQFLYFKITPVDDAWIAEGLFTLSPLNIYIFNSLTKAFILEFEWNLVSLTNGMKIIKTKETSNSLNVIRTNNKFTFEFTIEILWCLIQCYRC